MKGGGVVSLQPRPIRLALEAQQGVGLQLLVTDPTRSDEERMEETYIGLGPVG